MATRVYQTETEVDRARRRLRDLETAYEDGVFTQGVRVYFEDNGAADAIAIFASKAFSLSKSGLLLESEVFDVIHDAIVREGVEADCAVTSAQIDLAIQVGHRMAPSTETFVALDPTMPDDVEAKRKTSWSPLSLRPVLVGERRDDDLPTILERVDGVALVYPGKLHWVSSEPESGKTWLILKAVAQEIAAGNDVVIVDFEDSPEGTVDRLRALGVKDYEIESHLHYVQPDGPLTDVALQELAPALIAATLVTIDACSEAMGIQELDSYDNRDVERWIRTCVKPLARFGAAVLVADHVTKSKESRGRFSIGAQHKLAAIDGAAYTLTTAKPFGRGREGLVRVAVAKDRRGRVRGAAANGKTIADFRLVSDEETGAVAAELRPPTSENAGGGFRPTGYMESVSRYLEHQIEPVSTQQMMKTVIGGTSHKRAALECLVSEGFVKREGGPRNALVLSSIRSFREADAASTEGHDDVDPF
jgi:hypothetical protein